MYQCGGLKRSADAADIHDGNQRESKIQSVAQEWTCGKCGNLNYGDRRFCSVKMCWASRPQVAQEDLVQWLCAACGNNNVADQMMCSMPECGAVRPQNACGGGGVTIVGSVGAPAAFSSGPLGAASLAVGSWGPLGAPPIFRSSARASTSAPGLGVASATTNVGNLDSGCAGNLQADMLSSLVQQHRLGGQSGSGMPMQESGDEMERLAHIQAMAQLQMMMQIQQQQIQIQKAIGQSPILQPLPEGRSNGGERRINGEGGKDAWNCRWCGNKNFADRQVCNMRSCAKPRDDISPAEAELLSLRGRPLASKLASRS